MSERSRTVDVQSEQPNELKRGIKGWQMSLIGIGGVMGSCYFLGLGVLIHDMGPAVFLAFALVGVIVYGLMISYAELLVNLPRKGSFVAYTNEFLGETVSAGMGWSFWFNWVCYVPSEAIAAAIVINAFFKGNTAAYAIGALALLTIINLAAVDVFAKIESVLALTKICVTVLFIIVAFGIWIGLWGNEGFLGSSVNFGSGSLTADIFPNGFGIVITSMVIVLVTFQGTEIVGLAAAEAEDPEKAVPKACKSVTYRIVGLYMVPIAMILLIFPFGKATIENAVFAQVLQHYHMNFLAAVMSGVVLIAAFSCANTGFYGTVRCLYGLSIEGLAPKALSKLNKSSNPRYAVIFTLVFMWIVLMIGLFASKSSVYASLLSLSGFTGTLAWVGIIVSQQVFRKRLKKNGYDPDQVLTVKVKKSQSWVPRFAVGAQVACLALMAAGEGQFSIFLIACGAVGLPMIVYKIVKKTGHARSVKALGGDEKSFEETFPDLNKTAENKEKKGRNIPAFENK